MVKRWLPIIGIAVVIGAILYGAYLAYNLSGNGTKEDRAKADIKSLGQATVVYHAKHSKWPDNLEALTQIQPDGTPPIVTKKALIDPWGRPYQYDPTQLHARTEQPLIWSEGLDPANPPGKITNWD